MNVHIVFCIPVNELLIQSLGKNEMAKQLGKVFGILNGHLKLQTTEHNTLTEPCGSYAQVVDGISVAIECHSNSAALVIECKSN